MLELRPSCERCEAELSPVAANARICAFECTFCAECAEGPLGGVCPNCGGELVVRPALAAGFSVGPAAVLRRYAAAWQSGDLDRLLGCYGDDFTLHYGGGSRFAGTHVGKDAAVGVMAEVSVVAPRTLLSVDDVLVGGGGGALVVTERLERDGSSVEVQRVLRYRVADGLLRECWLLETDQATVDHFWR